MTEFEYLEKNVADVRRRMDNAAGGRGGAVLMAAVKYATAGEIDYIHKFCGVNDIGENRVPQLLEHWEKMDREGLNVHFIGTLQTNKVKYVVDKVCMIHSLDSEKLAAEIDRQCGKRQIKMDVLIEINSGREESKSGVLPEDAGALALKLADYENLNLRGFMTMAPAGSTSGEFRKYFAETYALAADLWKNLLHKAGDPVVSMGMTDSFEEAISEGATIVRVGSGIFGKKIIGKN